MDLLQLIEESRMVKLLTEICLTIRQQCLLKYSRDYNLTMDKEMYTRLKQDIDTDVWNLVKGFDHDSNVVDQRLLFMITGRGRDKHGGVDEQKFIYSEASEQAFSPSPGHELGVMSYSPPVSSDPNQYI